MATNIENSFEISENGLSLNSEAMILHGSVDPSLAPGQDAPIGSLYLRTGTPELYQKIGPTDTNWDLVGSSSSGNPDIPLVQLRRSSNQNLTTSFVDLNFDITDLETDSTILEHDNTNIDRVLIKETGLYQLQYSFSINANSGENVFNFRVRINDTSTIPASNRELSEDHEIHAVSNIFYAQLTAGDFISLQLKSDGAGDVLWSAGNFSIAKATAAQGIAGPAGAGSTINVEDDNVPLVNNPYSILNFGNGITVVDNNPQVDISVETPLFGSEFRMNQSQSVTITTSTTPQSKVLLNIPNLPTGRYRIGVSYGWNFNSTGNDFQSHIEEDGIRIGELHRQEPKDSAGNFMGTGSNQRHYINRTFYRSLNTGSHTFELFFNSRSSGTSASIWNAIIEFWRVG